MRKTAVTLFLIVLFIISVKALQTNSTNYQSSVDISSGGTNTSSVNYKNNLIIGTITGNSSSANYKNSLGFFYLAGKANNAPNITSASINSSDLSNKTDKDLNCFSTITDPDAGNKLNVSVNWYRNNILNFSIDYNNSYANGTLFVAILDNANTTKSENWKCGLRINDGSLYSSWSNSSNLTILNTLPVVNLTLPLDNNLTTNRTPSFFWDSSDADNDALEYEIDIICAGGCSDDNRLADGLNLRNYTVANYLNYLSDNGYYYNWSVRAYDGEGYGSFTAERKISIQSLVSISLPIGSVNFGAMNMSESKNTTSGNPAPLYIQNDGNSKCNITINSTALWNSVTGASSNYMFKIDNSNKTGSFDFGNSLTSWTNMPITGLLTAIVRLNWTDANDSANIDLLASVPVNEPAGNKSSIINFGASLGE